VSVKEGDGEFGDIVHLPGKPCSGLKHHLRSRPLADEKATPEYE
jgi:hypothetical protein